MPIVFRTSIDDKDFQSALARMQANAQTAGKKIESGLAANGHGAGGYGRGGSPTRVYGDALDAITGQFGGVMKMNAAVHTLGLSLGTAFAGVGAIMLAEQLYQSYEEARKLSLELTKIQRTTFGSSFMSSSEITKNVEAAHEIVLKSREAQGAGAGQSSIARFGAATLETMMDMSSMAIDGITGTKHVDIVKKNIADAEKIREGAGRQMLEQAKQETADMKLKKYGLLEASERRAVEKDADLKKGELMKSGLNQSPEIFNQIEEQKNIRLGEITKKYKAIALEQKQSIARGEDENEVNADRVAGFHKLADLEDSRVQHHEKIHELKARALATGKSTYSLQENENAAQENREASIRKGYQLKEDHEKALMDFSKEHTRIEQSRIGAPHLNRIADLEEATLRRKEKINALEEQQKATGIDNQPMIAAIRESAPAEEATINKRHKEQVQAAARAKLIGFSEQGHDMLQGQWEKKLSRAMMTPHDRAEARREERRLHRMEARVDRRNPELLRQMSRNEDRLRGLRREQQEVSIRKADVDAIVNGVKALIAQ